MANRTIELNQALHAYLVSVAVREPAVLAELRKETAALPMAMMQIAPEQGQFMALLIEMLGARRVLEIGTFTGYSSLAMALALPPGGRIIACDISEEYTAIARRYWARAGVQDRIDLRLGPAAATLDALLASGNAGGFDFVFIDADKTNYGLYYERALALLRPAGVVAVDNVLWGGDVANPAKDDPETRAIRALNEQVHTDARVSISLVPIGDGLLLARKRP